MFQEINNMGKLAQLKARAKEELSQKEKIIPIQPEQPDTIAKKPKKAYHYDPFLPPCTVCSNKASGHHFGAITCEACKVRTICDTYGPFRKHCWGGGEDFDFNQ